MLSRALFAMVFAAFGSLACASEQQDPTNNEPVVEAQQAMSRCGYPPRRPWPEGCRFTCECSGPVYGPFGEDPGDYVCYGGDCHLEPRGDCAFEMICE